MEESGDGGWQRQGEGSGRRLPWAVWGMRVCWALSLALLGASPCLLPCSPGGPFSRRPTCPGVGRSCLWPQGCPWRGAGEVSTRASPVLQVQAVIMLIPKGLLISRPSSCAVQGWGNLHPTRCLLMDGESTAVSSPSGLPRRLGEGPSLPPPSTCPL